MYKNTLILTLLAVITLTACSGGGDIGLPNPSQPPTNPHYAMAVTDTEKSLSENSNVYFTVDWSVVDLNPNTDVAPGSAPPVTYFALFYEDEIVQEQTQTYPIEIGNIGDPHTNTLNFTVTQEEYEPYCGETINLVAAANPSQQGLINTAELLEEAEIPEPVPENKTFEVPGSYGSIWEDSLTINCEGNGTDY